MRVERCRSGTGQGTGRALGMALLLAAVAAWPGTGPAPRAGAGAQDAGTAPLLVGGDMRGEIKPCGCASEGQLGGLPRRLTYLEGVLSAGEGPRPILVDTGNNFPEPSPQGRLKVELIQDLLRRFPPAAILPGPNELAMGLQALDDRLPYVVSNDAVGEHFAPFRTVERAGARIGLFGYLAPEAVYQKFERRYRLEPVGEALLERWRRRMADAGHDRAVLLFRGPDAALRRLTASGLFDRIVVGNPHADELNQVTERRVDGRAFPQVPTKGQGLYRIPLSLDGGAAGEASVAWLTEAYADHPAAVERFAAYDEQVRQLFFAHLERKKARAEESPYAGAQVCASCHPAAQETWQQSRHAHALATLKAVGKQHDPECLACHVVGLDDGGYLSQRITPQLANVQCENCHGPAKAHVADPAGTKTQRIPDGGAATGAAAKVCRTCHHGSHSPGFDFATYWPKVAH